MNVNELAVNKQIESEPAASPALATFPRDAFAYALVAAGARFIPLPLIDDIVKARANRGAISASLARHRVDIPSGHLSPLYSTGGVVAFVLRLPFKLLFFPVRKVLRIVGAVKGVPTDALETLLLARTIERMGAEGQIREGAKKENRVTARKIRRAFDKAFKGTNWKLLGAVLSVFRGKKDVSEADLEALQHEVERPGVQNEIAAFDARFDAAWADAIRK